MMSLGPAHFIASARRTKGLTERTSFARRSAGDRRGGADAGGPISVDPLPMPQFQHQQRPKTMAVIENARLMVVEQLADRLRAEISAREGPGIQQHLTRKILPFVAKPMRERNAKSHLRAPQGGRRQQ